MTTTTTTAYELGRMPEDLPRAGRLVHAEVVDLMLRPEVPEPIRKAAEAFRRVNVEYLDLHSRYPRRRRDAARARVDRDALDSEAAVTGRPVDPKAAARLEGEAAKADADVLAMHDRALVLRPAYQECYKALSLAIREHGHQWGANLLAGQADHADRLQMAAQTIYDVGEEKREVVRIVKLIDAVMFGSGRDVAPEPGIATVIPSSLPGAPLWAPLPGGGACDLADLMDAVTGLQAYRNTWDALAGPTPLAGYEAVTIANQEAANIPYEQRVVVVDPDDPTA